MVSGITPRLQTLASRLVVRSPIAMDVISQCRLSVAKRAWRSGQGGFALTVVCKATFELKPDLSPLAATQEPVTAADAYAHAGRGSLVLASDLAPFKQWPEVLVLGHAYAPDGQAAASLVARIVVGPVDKSVQVDGDRYFDEDGWISDPEPFTRMPLSWERAAGGHGTLNPAGVALGADAQPDASGRVPAPNLLPPGLFLTSRRKAVPPVGLGPIAPRWPSRASFLHRHAAEWDPDHWSDWPLPADVDAAYFNAAPSDQQRQEPFAEESIYLENLHPRHPKLTTRLAAVTPAAIVEQGGPPQPLRLRCDTLVIDTDRGLAVLVWRAHLMLDRPDAPGRIVITGPGVPEARPSAPAAPRPSGPVAPPLVPAEPPPAPFARKATMDVNQLHRAKAVLPFMRKTANVNPEEVKPKDAALPFQDQGARAQSLGSGFTLGRTSTPPPAESGAPSALPFGPARADTVLPPESGGPAPVLPFGPPRADTAQPPESAPSASAFPFGAARFVAPSSLRPRNPISRDDGEHTLTGVALPARPLPFDSPDSTVDDALAPTPPRGIPAVSLIAQPRPPSFGLPPEPAQPAFSPAPAAPPPTFGLPPEAPQPVFGRPLEVGPSALSLPLDAGPPAFSPAVEPRAPALTPPVESLTPAPVFSLVTASAPAEDPDTDPQLARIRLVQQAIWKGDRPTRQILADHGLTEIEWRALKRSTTRKTAAARA